MLVEIIGESEAYDLSRKLLPILIRLPLRFRRIATCLARPPGVVAGVMLTRPSLAPKPLQV